MNPTTLSNQRRSIEKVLTQSEKEDIKGKLREETNHIDPNPASSEVLTIDNINADTERNNTVNANTQLRVGTTMMRGEASIESNEPEEEIDEAELEEERKMKDDLIVTFTRVKNEEMNKRMRPNKFIIHKENRDKLERMNKILTKFVEEENNMDITNLNALHYSAAVTLTGTQKPSNNNPKDRPDPDEYIKKKD